MALRIRIACWILLSVPVAHGQGQLWVVDDDGGPGVAFTQLQPAIDAASSGDTILVRDGNYGSFLLAGKGLVVVGDANASVRCAGGIVRGVHTGSVLLQGLDMDLFPGGLEVRESTAPIWIEECRITGSITAVEIRDCTSVALVECTVPGSASTTGLRIENTVGQQVFVHDSSILGGVGCQGIPGFFGFGCPGEPGVVLDGGRLVLTGGSMGGGDGGNGFDPPCSGGPMGPGPFGSEGGAGLLVLAGSAHSLGTQFSGGMGGFQAPGAGCPTGPGGPYGQSIHVTSGTHTAWPGDHVSLDVPSPLRSGELSTLTLQGAVPGAPTYLFLSVAQEHLFFPSWKGGLLLPPSNMLVRAQGLFPASNVLSLDFTAPDLPVGTDHLGVHMQAALDVPGGPVLSAASFVLFLDASL